MTMRCKICNHDLRIDIDRQLVMGKNKGTIAKKFDVSLSSLSRHEANHLSRQLLQHYDKKREQEQMLKASWDYWERQGLDHPEKRVVTNQLITPMGDNHETK